METLQLKDCNEFLKENLSKEDIEFIANKIQSNYNTVKKYIDGSFPDNTLFKLLSPKIVFYGMEIILKKSESILNESVSITDKISEILKEKMIPTI